MSSFRAAYLFPQDLWTPPAAPPASVTCIGYGFAASCFSNGGRTQRGELLFMMWSTRREQVRCHAYLCVAVAARNRQNRRRSSSLLRPVSTRRVRRDNARKIGWFRLDWFGHLAQHKFVELLRKRNLGEFSAPNQSSVPGPLRHAGERGVCDNQVSDRPVRFACCQLAPALGGKFSGSLCASSRTSAVSASPRSWATLVLQRTRNPVPPGGLNPRWLSGARSQPKGSRPPSPDGPRRRGRLFYPYDLVT